MYKIFGSSESFAGDIDKVAPLSCNLSNGLTMKHHLEKEKKL